MDLHVFEEPVLRMGHFYVVYLIPTRPPNRLWTEQRSGSRKRNGRKTTNLKQRDMVLRMEPAVGLSLGLAAGLLHLRNGRELAQHDLMEGRNLQLPTPTTCDPFLIIGPQYLNTRAFFIADEAYLPAPALRLSVDRVHQYSCIEDLEA